MKDGGSTNSQNPDWVHIQYLADLAHVPLFVVVESCHQALPLGKVLDRGSQVLGYFSLHTAKKRILLRRTWGVLYLILARAVFAWPMQSANLQTVQIA